MKCFVCGLSFRAGPKNRDANAFVRFSRPHSIEWIVMCNISSNVAPMNRGSAFPRCYVVVIVVISGRDDRGVAQFFRHDGRAQVCFQYTNPFRAYAARCHVFVLNDFIMFKRKSIGRDGNERQLAVVNHYVNDALVTMPNCLVGHGPVMAVGVLRQEVEVEVRTVGRDDFLYVEE